MENATKALLIAAAVLIVILLIAFGMRIMNSTGDAGSQAQTQGEATSMQSFNAKFTAYTGNQQVSVIRNLVAAVNSSNKVNTSHKVEIDATAAIGTGKTFEKFACTNANKSDYTMTLDSNATEATIVSVTLSYDTNGYINKITLK